VAAIIQVRLALPQPVADFFGGISRSLNDFFHGRIEEAVRDERNREARDGA
jgi:hypothetical protein